jgi:hypothetical protein
METLEQRIQRVLKDEVTIVPYDRRRPELFHRERLTL